jgi:hypothetical protein
MQLWHFLGLTTCGIIHLHPTDAFSVVPHKQLSAQLLIQLKQIRHPLTIIVKRATIGGFHGFVKFLVGL